MIAGTGDPVPMEVPLKVARHEAGQGSVGRAEVFMRDRAGPRVARFAPIESKPRWHDVPARAGHLLVGFLLALTAVNMLALTPIG